MTDKTLGKPDDLTLLTSSQVVKLVSDLGAKWNDFVYPTFIDNSYPLYAEGIIRTGNWLALIGNSKWGNDGESAQNLKRQAYVSFSFPSKEKDPSADKIYPNPYTGQQPTSFEEFSSYQITAAKNALQRFSDVADIEFVDNGIKDAAIRYGNTSHLALKTQQKGYDFLLGEAYAPGPAAPESRTNSGDVWISATKIDRMASTDWAPGSQGYYLILHETGHALGLKHPHEDPNKNSNIDSVVNTVMSIKPFTEGSKEYSLQFYPTTPMPYDIAALQFIYGVNWSHNAPVYENGVLKDDGNTTYKFDGKTPFFETIWDAGGNDTIDFRDAEFPATINLNNGELSWIDDPNGTYRVAIAFARTDDPKDDPATPENEARNDTIENAKGGSGNDTIHGNDAANSLAGNAGNDDLFGEDGNDWLDGGSDLDRLYGGNGRDTIKGGPGNDEALGGDGNDWITMGDGNDWARGGAGNDTVDGGSGENKLYGDAGDDALVGQPTDDRLYGSYRHPDPRGDPRPDGDDVFKIVGDDIPPYVTGQNNTILYTFGHRLDRRDHYGNGDKIDLSELAGGGWKLIHSGDALKPGTIKVTNHDINLWKVDGYAVSQLVGKDKDGDYFQLFIDDGPANGWDYRVKDFIGVTSDFPDLA